MIAQQELITEATVTGEGMSVTHTLEYVSDRRPYTRTQIWAREFAWRGLDLHSDRLQAQALAHLERIGYRPIDGGWWLLDGSNGEHWYAVLERIPGSSAGWND